MKKSLFKSLLITSLVSVIGIGNVMAAESVYEEEQSTNVSDYKVEVKANGMGTLANTTYVRVDGLTTRNASKYLIKFVDKDTPKPEEALYSDLNIGNSINDYITNDNKSIWVDDDIYLSSKEYVYVYNCTGKKDLRLACKPTTSEPIPVTKTEMRKYGLRYQYYLFTGKEDKKDNHLSLFPFFPDEVDNLNLNVKVGIIEDQEVLNSLAKSEADAMEKLYNYAKNATNGTTYSEKINSFKDVDINNLDVINGKYYYVFSDIEDPDNKYIDVSDVTVVMGHNNNLVNNVTWGTVSDVVPPEEPKYEYACYSCSNEYVWTAKGYQAKTCKLVDSITEKAKCVKNAKTGVEDYLLPGTLVLVVGGTAIALLSKKSKFRRI